MTQQKCTPWASRWCPVHGKCTCIVRREEFGVDGVRVWAEGTYFPSCNLHGVDTLHGIPMVRYRLKKKRRVQG